MASSPPTGNGSPRSRVPEARPPQLGEKTAVSMGGIVKIAMFGLGLARDDTNKARTEKKSASPASKALLSRGRTIATRSIEHIVGSTPKAMIALALATAPTSRALLADRSLRRRSGVPRHHGLHNLSFSVTQLLPSPHGSQSRPSAAERGSHTARARAPSTVCGSHPSAPA
jgi:hypothetical protein